MPSILKRNLLLELGLRAARFADRTGLARSRLVRATGRAMGGRLFRTRPGFPIPAASTRIDGFDLFLPKTTAAAYVLNHFEPITSRWIDAALHLGGTAVDVGANVGLHTLRMARAVGATGRVYAIEPPTDTLPFLRANVANSGFENIEILPVAASDQDGTREFFPQASGTLSGFFRRQGEEASSGVTVPTARLDELISGRLQLLKVDTEGAEIMVLRGAQRLIEENPEIVVISEWNFPMMLRTGQDLGALPKLLQDHGLRLELIDDTRRTRPVFEDVLHRIEHATFDPLSLYNLVAARPGHPVWTT